MLFNGCSQLIHILLDQQSCAQQEASFETVHLLVYHVSKQQPECRDKEHTKFHLVVCIYFSFTTPAIFPALIFSFIILSLIIYGEEDNYTT